MLSERMHQSCRKSNDGILFEQTFELTSRRPTTSRRPMIQYKTTKETKDYKAEEQEYIKPRERKSGISTANTPTVYLVLCGLLAYNVVMETR